MKKKPCQLLLSLILVLFSVFPILANDNFFDEGLRHLMNGNPREAAVLFELLIKQENPQPDFYLYLAYSYEQLGLYDEGISVLKNGLEFSGNWRHKYYFNLGNLYVHKQKFEEAIEYYDLAINYRPDYASAHLNKASIQLRSWKLQEAISGYQTFVQLAPDHDLTLNVRNMIQAINDEVLAERARIIEEERLAAIAAERRRIEAVEAEQKKREEELRRQTILDDILGKLNAAGNESKTLGAGTEDIVNEEKEFMRAE